MSHWNAERIKELRQKHKESQSRFAKRLGCSVEALRWWEQGRGAPGGPASILMDRIAEDAELGQIRPHPDELLEKLHA